MYHPTPQRPPTPEISGLASLWRVTKLCIGGLIWFAVIGAVCVFYWVYGT